MTKRRIVITGLGMITPLGNTVCETWSNVLAGKSGITRWGHPDAEQYRSQICGLVKDFSPETYLSVKEIRQYDPFIQYGVAAAVQAIDDSGLSFESLDLTRIGVSIGSGIGGLDTIETNMAQALEVGPRKIAPSFIPGTIINTLSGMVSIRYGLKGPNLSLVTACTTGTHNIAVASRLISYGDADVMIVGGAEHASTLLGIGGFSAMRALSSRNDDPQRASRPWDKDRDGFVLGNGSGVLVLESYEHAVARGAHIYAELAGAGFSADAFHMTLPHQEGDGAIRSMTIACDDARIDKTDVDYINAHGTSTPAGDKIEALAIKSCFKDHAHELAVSSTKSALGHLLGATGAVEAILSVLAIRDQVAPPTLNLDKPDEGCDLNFVPHVAQERTIKVVLSNSFGFGGTNGSLVFKQFEA